MVKSRWEGRQRAPARASAGSRPGCSISTTRSIRITSISGTRSTSASATTSSTFSSHATTKHSGCRRIYRRYGTTMRGLMEEHGLDPDEFLEVVHQIDHSPLTPEPGARRRDRRTARPQTHPHQRHARARRSGDARGSKSTQHFEDVFDIAAAELEPKPRPQVYDRFLARTASIRPRRRCSKTWPAISKCRTRSA